MLNQYRNANYILSAQKGDVTCKFVGIFLAPGFNFAEIRAELTLYRRGVPSKLTSCVLLETYGNCSGSYDLALEVL